MNYQLYRHEGIPGTAVERTPRPPREALLKTYIGYDFAEARRKALKFIEEQGHAKKHLTHFPMGKGCYAWLVTEAFIGIPVELFILTEAEGN